MKDRKEFRSEMMFDFINDLDEFFCEKYANYDRLCILPGYKMPKMHASKVREDGRTYAYTLPANTMRLAAQEKKSELLATLKKQMSDKTFSFSFNPLGFFARIKNKTSKNGFVKIFGEVLTHYSLTPASAGEGLNVDSKIWENICKGNFLPSKNLLFTLALTAHMSMADTELLLAVCEYEFDYTVIKDVVIAYLLNEKIFNAPMQQAALAEYKVENLFIKEE